MKVGIIGAGNAARYILERCQIKNIEVPQLYNRDQEKAQELVKGTNTQVISSADLFSSDIDILVFAISESAIADIYQKCNLSPDGPMLISMSGGTSVEELPESQDWTVLWPVYSLIPGVSSMDDVPIVLTMSAAEKYHAPSIEFAQDLSDTVYKLAEADRLQTHLSAVFANNFVNFLNTEMFGLMQEKDLSYQIIEPIMQQTLRNSITHRENSKITGPAARRDYPTMEQHEKLLENDPVLQLLYKQISQAIIQKTTD